MPNQPPLCFFNITCGTFCVSPTRIELADNNAERVARDQVVACTALAESTKVREAVCYSAKGAGRYGRLCRNGVPKCVPCQFYLMKLVLLLPKTSLAQGLRAILVQRNPESTLFRCYLHAVFP